MDDLLGAGYRVVRFDPRETGRSDRVEDWRRTDAFTVVDVARRHRRVPAGPHDALPLGVRLEGTSAASLPDRGGEKNLVMERVAKALAAGEHLSPEQVRNLGRQVLYDHRNRRGVNLAAFFFRHQVAAASTSPRGAGLGRLEVPTLVVHGEDDPTFPVQHGRRLAATGPGARGSRLQGTGHMFPYPDMDAVTHAIVRHLRRAGDGADWAGRSERTINT